MGFGWWSWIILLRKGGSDHACGIGVSGMFLNEPLSTYQQQVRGLACLCCNECPWAVILMDLENEIHQWQEGGENLILMTEFNEDVRLAWIK